MFSKSVFLLALVALAAAEETTTTTTEEPSTVLGDGADKLDGDSASVSASSSKKKNKKDKKNKAAKLGKGGKYVGIEDKMVPVIQADQAPPTCDADLNGWHHENINAVDNGGDATLAKINWYFYSEGANGAGTDDLVGNLNTFWVKYVRTGGTKAPWMTVYTQPSPGSCCRWDVTCDQTGGAGPHVIANGDKACWYRSRVNLIEGTVPNVGDEVVIYMGAKPTVEQFPTLTGSETYLDFGDINNQPSGNVNSPSYGSIDSEKLKLISLSSNSGDLTGNQDWTVLSTGYHVEGERKVLFRTTCNGKKGPLSANGPSGQSVSASSIATLVGAGVLVAGVAHVAVRRQQHTSGYKHIDEENEISIESTPLVDQAAILEV